MPGTRIEVELVSVVDGDTVKVQRNGEVINIRILSLDTEESRRGGNKPMTPWGIEAKHEAESFFAGQTSVVLEFPGNEAADEAWIRYRGNYGRPLCWVYKKDGDDLIDFQAHMIRWGFSPYFVKYGFAEYPEKHARYTLAEHAAQADFIGVWNQLAVNAQEMRNYALLGVWWHLRAKVIDGYRAGKLAHPEADVYDSRLDYAKLLELAQQEAGVTVFTELAELKFTNTQKHMLASIGSQQQPFQVFIPNVEGENGRDIVNLLLTRYIPSDETHPARSYVYLTGELEVFNEKPEIVLTNMNQITDSWPVLE